MPPCGDRQVPAGHVPREVSLEQQEPGMTEQVQEVNKTRKLGKQLTTVGGVLIAASIVLAMF